MGTRAAPTRSGRSPGTSGHYIDNQIPVWVPIYDSATKQTNGNGARAASDTVGFGAIVFIDENGIQHPDGTEHECCAGPGGSFKFGVTGEVQLRR